MNTSFEDRVKLFCMILDEQIAEIDLLESGKKINLFYDSKDIRYTIFGLSELFDGHRFSLSLFQSEAAMVQCLGFSGWLGEMNMLQPHQSELLSALRQANVPKIDSWDKFVLDFLRELSYKQPLPSIEGMPPTELFDHVKRYAGSTYEAFKVFQYIKHASDWRLRLKVLRSDGILNLDMPRRIDADLVTSEDFKKIKRIIDRRRPKTPLNNFADAVALVLLMIEVSHFNEGSGKMLPLYFDTTSRSGGSGFFQDVIEDAGLSKRLSYSLGEKNYSALKPASYFRFRAMFRPPISKASGSPSGSLHQVLTIESLRKLSTDIGDIIKTREITEDVVVPLLRVPLGQVVENREDFSFFKHVWETSLAESDARTVLGELNLAQLGDPEFIKGVEDALAETLDVLERNTEEHRWAGNVWTKLQERAMLLVGEGDFSRDFRLARFALPFSTQQHIQSVLTGLSGIRGEIEREQALKLVIQACYRLLQGRLAGGRGEEYERELSLAASLLWLIDMYEDSLSCSTNNAHFLIILSN